MDLYAGVALAALIFLASLVSVELGLSAAIIEITLGVVAGNFLGLEQTEWMKYIAGGMNISLPLLGANIGLFLLLLAVKLAAKFAGVYPVSKVYIPREAAYTTLLMSTGLTMGTISSVFGFQTGIIDRAQFSVLVSVVVASAILPTFFAQRYFHPKHAFEALGSEAEPELLEGGSPPAGPRA